jgi:hypothetical protein
MFLTLVLKVESQLLIPKYGGKSMKSKTTMMAAQYRLHEWAEQVRDCQNRPSGTSVSDWCAGRGITKADYYYRLRRVREACLESLPDEAQARQMVPVNSGLLQREERDGGNTEPGLYISTKGFFVRVTASTPMPLLAAVLEVMRHVE